MPIGIVTDSTCDLPEELVAEHAISVVPHHINVGDESYLDGVDLSRQEFYERLPGWETRRKPLRQTLEFSGGSTNDWRTKAP